MTNTKKVTLSILMSTYNDALYLEVAVNSIIKQNFENWELLICDDGSTDKTKSILKKYEEHSKISVFYNPVNKGKSDTINQLLERSNGTYVSVHDADDWSECNRFEMQVNFLESTDYQMCGCDFYRHTPNGTKTVRMPRVYEDIRVKLPAMSQFHGPTLVFRRDIINEVGGLFREFTWGEDIDFTSRVVEKYPATNIPFSLYHYRIHGKSLTNDLSRLKASRFINNKLREILHEQRKVSGSDMLMEERKQEFESLRESLIQEIRLNPSELYWDFSQRLLDLDLYKEALKSAYRAFQEEISYKNLKNLIFMLLKNINKWVKSTQRKK
ncbi:MAG: glycosyltransferase family 2 protein [Marinoscillum sp.]